MAGYQLEKIARSSSPISHLSKDAPRFLLFHGTADQTVDVKHSDRSVAALKRPGASDVTYHRIDGAGHGVFNQSRSLSGIAMKKFFQRSLKLSKADWSGVCAKMVAKFAAEALPPSLNRG